MLFPNLSANEEMGVHAALGRTAAAVCSHAVHFYEDDAIFLDSLGHFIAGALGAGGACIAIVSQPHREELACRLAGQGFDLSLITSLNRYFVLDVKETLLLASEDVRFC